MQFLKCFDDIMEVTTDDLVKINSTSKGNQIKWYKNGYFIKNNSSGYESVAEVIVSKLLSYSDLDYVPYEFCTIKCQDRLYTRCCRSLNFLKKEERDITFYRALFQYGLENEPTDYDTLRDNIFQIAGFDCRGYLDNCICLDAITCNEDRHLNNLSLIIGKNENYKIAPIYDNGLSCLSDLYSYPMDRDYKELIKMVKAKPFFTSFERQLELIGTPIVLDMASFFREVSINSREEERAVNVIHYQSELYKGIAWVQR